MANRITRDYCRLFHSAKTPDDQERFWDDVAADFEQNNVTSSDFSVRQLFEEFVTDSHGDSCGKEIVESWTPDGGYDVTITEAAGATTTASMSRITGQIIYNEIMSAWDNPAFIADELTRTIPTAFMDGEKIAGISVVGDDNEKIGETQPYPLTGISEEFVETPRPEKRGQIVPLSREVIMTDRTGVLLQRANTVATSMRVNKEKRVLDTVLGVDQTWKRNGSVATVTYATSTTAPHDFTNLITDVLADFTDIDAAMQAFNAITDPNTGEPVSISVNALLVASPKLYTARRVVNATEVRGTDGDFETLSPNPLSTPNFNGTTAVLNILHSPYIGLRAVNGFGATNDNNWWLGNFQRAFAYMQFWPLSVTMLPDNSMWEFQNDIVRAWKVSEFGVPAVIQPRYALRSNATT